MSHEQQSYLSLIRSVFAQANQQHADRQKEDPWGWYAAPTKLGGHSISTNLDGSNPQLQPANEGAPQPRSRTLLDGGPRPQPAKTEYGKPASDGRREPALLAYNGDVPPFVNMNDSKRTVFMQGVSGAQEQGRKAFYPTPEEQRQAEIKNRSMAADIRAMYAAEEGQQLEPWVAQRRKTLDAMANTVGGNPVNERAAYLDALLRKGYGKSIPGQSILPNEESFSEQRLQRHLAYDGGLVPPEDNQPISSEDWEKSSFYRPDLTYSPNWTVYGAKLAAAASDLEVFRARVIEYGKHRFDSLPDRAGAGLVEDAGDPLTPPPAKEAKYIIQAGKGVKLDDGRKYIMEEMYRSNRDAAEAEREKRKGTGK